MKTLKKIALYAFLLVAVVYGYQLITGENITALPKKIVDALYHPETQTKSANVHYYEESPAKDIK